MGTIGNYTVPLPSGELGSPPTTDAGLAVADGAGLGYRRHIEAGEPAGRSDKCRPPQRDDDRIAGADAFRSGAARRPRRRQHGLAHRPRTARPVQDQLVQPVTVRRQVLLGHGDIGMPESVADNENIESFLSYHRRAHFLRRLCVDKPCGSPSA